VIGPSGAVTVMIAAKPVDFRKGGGVARIGEGRDRCRPILRHGHVFQAKRTNCIKLIFWDGSRVCLVAKRFEDSEFQWR